MSTKILQIALKGPDRDIIVGWMHGDEPDNAQALHRAGMKRLRVKVVGADGTGAAMAGRNEGLLFLVDVGNGRLLGVESVDESQAEEVRAVLTDAFLAVPEAPYWLSLHGLGAVTAATILAEIGDPSYYRQPAQWVKLAGIQPVPNTSGRKAHSQTPMSHKGRSRLRTALFFAVMRLVQVDESFARSYGYYQQREKNPLTKMQALGALMNKLLHVLWALGKRRVFYDPAFAMPA